MIRKYSIFLLFLLVLLTGACSTTEKISDGEQLYVGIKSTKYHRETGDAKDKTTIQAFNTAKEEVDVSKGQLNNAVQEVKDSLNTKTKENRDNLSKEFFKEL